MAQPLRDVRTLNIASLLSRRGIPSALDFSVANHTNSIKLHVLMAGLAFEKTCKDPPPQDAQRNDIFRRLQKASNYGLTALWQQLRSRRQTDPDTAKDLAKTILANLGGLPQQTPHQL